MTNKYTRTFSDFANYPWPGKILPEYFEHPNYSDGYRGIQGMTQGIISSYGAYHIVEGASPTIAGTEWTGTAAYGMFSGVIKLLAAASGNLAAAGSYLVYNVAGTFAVTGAKPTGLILAKNIGGTVYTAARRQDVNSKEYFPNDTYHYGNIYTYGNIYGNLDNISGYEKISANSGYFSVLGGFSDITMRDSIDFDDTYHIKGASQITGAIINGTQITGAILMTNGKINSSNITGTIISGLQITGTSGVYGDFIGTTSTITTLDGTSLNYTQISGSIISGIQFTGTQGYFATDIISAKGDFTTSLTGAAITGVLNGAVTLTEAMDANSKLISNILAPVSDDDAATKEYVDDTGEGVEAATVVHLNAAEVDTRLDSYTKIKETKAYVHLSRFRVAWDHKRLSGTDTANTKVYVNGVAVGVEKSTTSGTYAEVSDDIVMDIRPGDLIQLYGKTGDNSTYVWVQNFEIRYDKFASII